MMTIKQAIDHTKNKKGIKICLPGLLGTVSTHKGNLNRGYRFALQEVSKHFDQAQEAWLHGDLETVADFFGLYVGSRIDK